MNATCEGYYGMASFFGGVLVGLLIMLILMTYQKPRPAEKKEN
jgi:hypothetical protein